jgi:predicted dehydrogenase
MCFVAFQRRFDPNFMRLKKAVTNGEVSHCTVISCAQLILSIAV